MKYKIEGVPVTDMSYSPSGRHKPGVAHYPIRQLELGQSFLVPPEEAKYIKTAVQTANGNNIHGPRRYKLIKLDNGWFRVGRTL